MIELIDVCKKFGEFTAIDKLNLNIKKGEILGLLGPNGAGKTTTMRMITGFFPQTAGTIRIDGIDISQKTVDIREKIGYLPESNPLYYDMRVYEYLNYIARLKKVGKVSEKVEEVIEKTGLIEMKRRLIGNLSKGYKQRVGIAQALINEPQILILDEPTSGLDPKQIVDIRDLIRSFAKEHTVILSTHILPEVKVTCDRVAIMNRGKIIALETVNDLINKFKKGKGSDIFMQLKGKIGDIEKVLKGFKVEFDLLKTEDLVDVHIKKTYRDIRFELNREMMKKEVEVYELYSKNPELEEVFISLVKEEEGE